GCMMTIIGLREWRGQSEDRGHEAHGATNPDNAARSTLPRAVRTRSRLLGGLLGGGGAGLISGIAVYVLHGRHQPDSGMSAVLWVAGVTGAVGALLGAASGVEK